MSEETFGKVLKEARLALGSSQQDLARKLGVRASHVGYLEQGRRRPSLTLLNALADTLGVDKERLFLLSHPEAKEPDQETARESAPTQGSQCLAGVACGQSGADPQQCDPQRAQSAVAYRIARHVLKPRDYLFILNCIRQAVKE